MTTPRTWLSAAGAVATALALLPVTTHATDVIFTNMGSSPLPTARSLDWVDFDGDGDLDMALVQTNVSWNENVAGDGSTWANHVISTAQHWEGASGDIDGDGDVDMFTLHFGGVSWHENTSGDGTLWTAQTISGALGTNPVAVDMDADGDLDLAMIDVSAPSVVTWFDNTAGDGSAWIQHSQPHLASFVLRSLCAGDLDGDGDTDLVTAEDLVLTPSVTVTSVTAWLNLSGNGQGYYQKFITYVSAGPQSAASVIALADMDVDGDLDLLQQIGSSLVWLSNYGSGVFDLPQTILQSLPQALTDLTVADLDQDQDMDVVAVGWTWLNWVESSSSGWLSQPISVPSFGGATALDSVDFNQDGVPDITVSGNQNFSPFFHLRNDNPWANLAAALPGTNGSSKLIGSGSLQGGTSVSLALSGALQNTTVTLVEGLTEINAPFKGGVLVPSPDLILPGLLTDGNGGLLLGGTWPVGFPSGLDIYFQLWVNDPAAPAGFASSNGLRGTTP